MVHPKSVRHYHTRHGYSYPVTQGQKIYAVILTPLLIFGALLLLAQFLPTVASQQFSLNYIITALSATFLRLIISYAFALALAIPLAFMIAQSKHAEKILLPIFDILQSVPILAFLPIIIFFFVKNQFFNGAAIFVIFVSILWTIFFSVIGGLRVIPVDIISAAKVFKIQGLSYYYKVLLPAVFPEIITGSLLAWAQAWNIIIVAEVLHTYIPGGTSGQDLFGIGSTLVNAVSNGQDRLFISSLLIMILAIAFLNIFIWQKLLHYAEKFIFE